MSATDNWKEKELQRRTRELLKRCVHFNGIMNDSCDAGVNYKELLGDGPGWAAHMPCFNDEKSSVNCPLASFRTPEQARKEIDEQEVQIVEFIQQLNDSICPTCKVQVRQRQVGPCVYGTCGHRLYQGKVNPQFAQQEKRIHSTRRLSR
jgi:hypothetical protein